MIRILKSVLFSVLFIILIVALVILSLVSYYKNIVSIDTQKLQVKAQPGELGKWVNPFIGTGGIPWVCGHNFPGVSLPFGMVRLGPETASILINKKALNTSGYYYGDNKIIGFSHTRLVGTGATDGGFFLVFPATGKVTQKVRTSGLYTKFSHEEEIAFPGYYAVKLPKLDVLAELTATQRVGMHRYTFSNVETPHILIKVTNALGDGRSREGQVSILPETNEIEGSVRTFGSFSGRYGGIKVYFVARFNQPFLEYGSWNNDIFLPDKHNAEGNNIGIDLSFKKKNSQQVIELKLAISFVSIENARENLEVETGQKSFEEIMAEAKSAWEEKLSLIKIDGCSENQRTIFYSALYRTFQMPTIFNDVNGEYFGFDKRIHKAEGFQYFTDLSLWDTFRTVHPLYTIIAPQDQRDMLVSLVEMSKQGGWLPRWPSGNGYTNSMLGTPADIVIAESYLKGIRNFDVETAYQKMRETALSATSKGAPFSGREGGDLYMKYQYCPAEKMKEAVSRTIEFGWSDFAIANLAETLGKEEDTKLFSAQSKYYQNLWNPETQYFQPRFSAGNFVDEFKPLLLTYLDSDGKYTNDYVEGSALQWRWGPFYDAKGLISLFKDRQYYVNELNDFFTESDPKMGAWNPGSFYWHGNEPDMHAAYLFNDADRPDLTQKWVRWILENKYGIGFDGLDGNDDAGTLSAWYIFSALGFYPVAGSDKYQIGAPLFQKTEVKVGNDLLTIVANNYSLRNIYVQKVWLNDSLLDRSWLTHAEISSGGILIFEMGEQPAN
jgi:predicted alpha-1,2-mannosidase